MSPYNYPSFPRKLEGQDFERFPELARAGSRAPDGELIDARDETRVNLSELWRRDVTVIEFGSVT